MKNLGVLLIVVIFLNSCSNNRNPEVNGNVIEISLDKVFDKYNEKDYFDNEGLIPLETNDSSLIGNVDKVLLTKDGFVILDKKRKCVLLFTEDGKFVRKVYSVGRGPEEYVYMSDIINSPNGGFYGLDNRASNILEYNAKGIFLKKYSFSQLPIGAAHYFQHIRNSVFAFYSISDEKRLVLYDLEKGKILDYVKEERTNKIATKTPFGHVYSYPFIKINNTLCYYEKYDNVIYSIANDSIQPFLTLNFIDEQFVDLNNISNEKNARENMKSIINSGVISLSYLSCIDKSLILTFRSGNHAYIALCDMGKKTVKVFKYDDDTYFKKKIGTGERTAYSILSPARESDLNRISELTSNTDIQVNINDNYYIEKLRLRNY